MMKIEMAETVQHADFLEACKLNDRKAQEKIYDLYAHALFNASLRIVNHTGEAEDLMQESFIEAFEKIHTFRGEGSIGAWLKRIVVNKSINYLRQKKALIGFEDAQMEIPDEDTSAEEYSENLFCRLEEVKQGIGRLPANYRIIISLHLLEGYDHNEISEILNISYQNARTKFVRAKQKLLQIIMDTRV
jgi:RNA polymerase sigma-70 factor (ECF subfamily)